MYNLPPATQPTVIRRPHHPLECLRLVDLPGCVVCGKLTILYCGGCQAQPAFCSVDHFVTVSMGRFKFVCVFYISFVNSIGRYIQYLVTGMSRPILF